MRQNKIAALNKLNSESYENIFNVYRDKGDMYYYNLLQTVVFPKNLPIGLFDSYAISYGDTWPFISYKVYNTPNLWWIILLANDIDNPTILPKPGNFISIPNEQIVKEILTQIRK